MQPFRRISVVALGCGLGLLVSCGGSSTSKIGASPSSSPESAAAVPTTAAPASTAPGSTAATPSAVPTTTPARTTPTGGGLPGCTTGQLTVTLLPGQGAAGTDYNGIGFRNHGPSPCTLRGYPGVSLLDGHGRTLGQPAQRVPAPVATVVLKPGQVASALLTVSPPACSGGLPPQGSALRVFPPGQKADVVVAAQLPACQPRIRPVRPGADVSAS